MAAFSRTSFTFISLFLAITLGLSCGTNTKDASVEEHTPSASLDGKSDQFDRFRQYRHYEVLFTDPFCDICTAEDKTYLSANSSIIARVIDLIDTAQSSVDVAQFTFSVRSIEAALLRAHERGVTVRIAMDKGQNRDGTASMRLKDAGLDVKFVQGAEVSSRDFNGLMHSKFMIVDQKTLLKGSNNWSSTGTSINEENTIVLQTVEDDPFILSFACHFDAIWNQSPEASGRCSTDKTAFSPSSAPRIMIRDAIRQATSSIDILMHHLLFDDHIRTLAQAAERGVKVRIILNEAERNHQSGRNWERLISAGAQLRYKRNNSDEYQLMHHKLAIVDGNRLLHGSGNWSGSGFFNNFEFYIDYTDPDVVKPFKNLYHRLWKWSLSSHALDQQWSAAYQHAQEHNVYFGNLHAHYDAVDEATGKVLDDGKLMRRDEELGEFYSVVEEVGELHVSRHAFEYARDKGKMDFMALSPHVVDDNDEDPLNHPNMSVQGYRELVKIANAVTQESHGKFVAMPAMEWNTNSNGNHVNIFGSYELAKVERGRFDLLYDEFLPTRKAEGDMPLLQLNHPRTFSRHEDNLSGNWDQIFDVYLSEIPNNSQRRYKFNDFGLDVYPPLSEVHEDWIEGRALPSREVVRETLQNIEKAARPFARLMEVTVGRGTDLASETPHNPSLVLRQNEETGDMEFERFVRVESDWHYYLLHGFRLAPTANHDNHYANWGTGHTSRTAIIAPQLTERALLEGIDRRLVYASEDENLAISFYAFERVPMGGETRTLREDVTLSFLFQDPDYDGPFDVRIMRGAVGADEVEVVDELNALTSQAWHEYTIQLPMQGSYFIYLEVLESEVNRMAWTAPIWVERVE